MHPLGSSAISFFAFVVLSILFLVRAQDCSTLSPCATGCCNKFGYCGVGDDYCGSDCVASCDYRPECDASNPCATGCCNKFGYCGLGPNYCAEDVCVAGCERRAECDPGGYGEFADSAKCPLNVCCSKFGFCGTTKDFCGTKKVRRPSCNKKNGLSRVVGYYEGWSMQRFCNDFYPEQIPVGVYTHLNYAFASIDPETFEILAPSSYESDMMRRLTALKRSDPDLKVFIAVGGWTFNDPGPTATVFSDMARSPRNRQAFFRSLLSFMSTYGFDGIDLDWEYPVADDRSGRPEDYENFVDLIANLKTFLKSSGGRHGLSITLPASYWYLQHFDIAKLQYWVDFFNIMSYDLHGAWDRNNKWLEPELNSHTNLTEITNALDLLWRNDIDPEKVVLGIAFYARVFSASSASCMEPGCKFESGGNAGRCSNEVGILLNSEIVEIMDELQVKPTFDKEAAVKILKFDSNQWLTYDDAETFKLKAEFASSQCLGGVMVWAVSHDLPYGNYSRALGEAANRKVKAIALGAQSGDAETRTVYPQCKWTNCWENCPAGWTLVQRTDDDAGDNQGMVDHTGCQKGTDHFFCCPPDAEVPKCGWYGHRNGKCNGKDNCPSGMLEVGSNTEHCENNNYQAACCTYDTPSMKLYSQCKWGQSPDCDKGTCSNSLVANSSTGTGGDYCSYRKYWEDAVGNYATYQERKYCCDQEDNSKWEDCEWYDSYGLLRIAEGTDLENYCWSNCPSDTVRVAMETRNGCEAADGGRVRCCKPKHLTIKKRSADDYTDENKVLDGQVQDFLDDPTCGLEQHLRLKRSWTDDVYIPDDASLGKFTSVIHFAGGVGDYLARGADTYNADIHGRSSSPQLARRATAVAEHAIEYLLLYILTSPPGLTDSQRMHMWEFRVQADYRHLSAANIRDYAYRTIDTLRDGYDAFVTMIVCNLDYYNALLGNEDFVLDCECEAEGCCLTGTDPCVEEEEGVPDSEDEDLVGRGKKRPINPTLADGKKFPFYGRTYEERYKVTKNRKHPLRSKAFHFALKSICHSGSMDVVPIKADKEVEDFDVEHQLEMNTIGQYVKHATNGNLPSKKPVPTGLAVLPVKYVRDHLTGKVLANPPIMKGGEKSNIPLVRIMNALGSRTNNGDFTLLLKQVNGVKSRLWMGKDPWAAEDLEDEVESTDPDVANEAISKIRAVVGAISYMNHIKVQPVMVSQAHEVEKELGLSDAAWQANGNGQGLGVRWWRLVYKDLLETRSAKATSFVERWTDELIKRWGVRTGSDAEQILDAALTLQKAETKIRMNGLNY
ncbi:uncharacterized protein DSM5745_09789 [Aspergillus mulundensis]|uniref:chitinase n=1 Tax=Aspergillus mulundensis TaxID=1810919 RepID=A0A3D8QRS5_9EURO|nr:Uncharacterized protein DSM5745_09789 [Aspergillus mulundensis]RDW64378.1 Uncharacterized protein DSM5745_09789 [Aspergillus mulundensis]